VQKSCWCGIASAPQWGPPSPLSLPLLCPHLPHHACSHSPLITGAAGPAHLTSRSGASFTQHRLLAALLHCCARSCLACFGHDGSHDDLCPLHWGLLPHWEQALFTLLSRALASHHLHPPWWLLDVASSLTQAAAACVSPLLLASGSAGAAPMRPAPLFDEQPVAWQFEFTRWSCALDPDWWLAG